MAKNIEASVARDVAAELLGETKSTRLPSVKEVVESANGKGKPSKAAKPVQGKAGKPAKGKAGKPTVAATPAKANGKGKPVNGKVGRPSPYTDDQKIIVVKPREGRGQKQLLWGLVAKSKTIGSYKLAREKIGLKGLGGIFASFVKDGNCKVK